MKFLDIASLDPINTALVFENPECRVVGRIETYSCKLAGVDKKLYKHLESQWNSDLSESVSPDHNHSLHDIISPFGPMDQPSSRRMLFNLIATLNASYPDYDFSDVKPDQFTKHQSVPMVIDEIIELDECSVYSFNPDNDSDPNAEDGAIWSFNFFFYNKKLKRILFFAVKCLSINAPLQDEEPLDTFSDSGSDVIGMSYEEYVMGDIEM
ncbi:unnamed protein product [Rhizophagus irregularis]|uniref:Repressor of RNA polymerase III transcription MAF1 n=1 Tax=Rhizophagus irregularis TaxID=588596 RepID=A0A915YXB5_9GLOM|nr:hypothetical protein OCT59_003161 [Rhizophagus irregularis]CAB4398133.1 unnamed protein product [Rhizophagus irregularis]CAB4407700.1 unnamed protein product [Rhizophagus irregularis]CAB4481216.1 unnamed protein product [Rhizophagus irregularis]CAB5352077.1 unnamed protein product [Rhizophagus irregularis]